MCVFECMMCKETKYKFSCTHELQRPKQQYVIGMHFIVHTYRTHRISWLCPYNKISENAAVPKQLFFLILPCLPPYVSHWMLKWKNSQLGVERKPITQDMEAMLWEKGIFSVESCKWLLNDVYFSMFLGWRSCNEHRSLDVKQFRLTISDGIDYVEYISRTKFLIISSRNVLMKLNYKVTLQTIVAKSLIQLSSSVWM